MGTNFKYCGGTDRFDLVSEYFDHDAPMLYFVENNGRKRWFHVGEDLIFATQDNQYLLSVHAEVGADLNLPTVLTLLSAQEENHGSYKGTRYQEETQCDLVQNPPKKGQKTLSLTVTRFTNEEILIEAREESPSEKSKELKSLGSVQMKRKNGKWDVVTQTLALEALKCHEFGKK